MPSYPRTRGLFRGWMSSAHGVYVPRSVTKKSSCRILARTGIPTYPHPRLRCAMVMRERTKRWRDAQKRSAASQKRLESRSLNPGLGRSAHATKNRTDRVVDITEAEALRGQDVHVFSQPLSRERNLGNPRAFVPYQKSTNKSSGRRRFL